MSLPSVIVSETRERFQRARDKLPRVFSPVVHTPAVFLKGNTSVCRGVEGHRIAMRNAWLIATLLPWTCIFEDDILRTAIQLPQMPQLLNPGLDIIYLGNLATLRGRVDVNDFFTTHAQCVSKRGAMRLLNITNKCIPKARCTVDFWMMKACRDGRLACRSGLNLFTQDRINVKPYLHDAKNQYIGHEYGR